MDQNSSQLIVYVSLLCWNLNHFNSTFDENVVKMIAQTVWSYDLIYFLEVSSPQRAPPLDGLVAEITKERERHKERVTYKYEHVKMDSSSWGVALYNANLVILKEELQVTWEDRNKPIRSPFTFQFAVKNSKKEDWNFCVSGVHLKSG